MKNALRVIAIVVVAALLFGIGYGLGSRSGITVNLSVEGSDTGAKTNTDVPATEAPTAAPTAAPTEAPTEAPSEAPTEATSEKKDEPAKEPEKKDEENKGGVPSSTAEIVAAYNKAINDTKAVGDVTINKTEKVDISVTDCSVSFVTDQVNDIVKGFITDTDDTLTFAGGQTAEGRSLDSFVPPSNRAASLAEAAVASASAKAAGDGYEMTIKLVPEKSTYDGTNTVNPEFNNSVVDPLNLATLEIPVAKITSADMDYPGTELVATVNAKGTLDKLVVTLPMKGTGEGKLIATLSVTLEGQLLDTYTFTY